MMANRSPYDEKIERILSAAAAVFAAKGYHNASIREIARMTGVSLSSLYYYFKSKEELLCLIQEHVLETLLDRLEERLSGVCDPHQRVRIMIESHLTYFVDNMAQMKVLSHEADTLKGDFQKRVTAKKRRLTRIATEILTELRPGNDVDPRVATFALFGMMNWLYTWYRPGRDVPIERLVEDMSLIYLSGFGPEPIAMGSGAGHETAGSNRQR